MPPKKILVVRQKLKTDGSVTLEPVAWKDDVDVETNQTCSGSSCVESTIKKDSSKQDDAAPSGVSVPSTSMSEFQVCCDTNEALDENDDVDFLAPGTCDAASVDNDKTLNLQESIDRDWFGGDFGSEVIDEMLGPGFAVTTNQEENLVPELGITEPMEDASLAALKCSPEKSFTRKRKKRAVREVTPVIPTPFPNDLPRWSRSTAPATYPRKCDICSKICYTKNEYRSHHSYEHTSRKFLSTSGEPRKCDFCDKTFTMKAAFTKHQRTMHWKELNLEEPRFPCRWCDRVYVACSSRIYHEMTVHRPKSFPCPLCGLVFKLYENLNKHLKTHNASCLRCFKCRNIFTNVDSLKKHFTNIHTDSEFDESMVLTNHSAQKRLVNGQFVSRRTRTSSTIAFESVEKLDEFLRQNPNYQIVQTDDNGQTSYHLVDGANPTVGVESTSQAKQVALELPHSDTAAGSSNDVNHGSPIFLQSNGAMPSEAQPSLTDQNSTNVLCTTTEPELALDQVSLSALPHLKGTLAFRCQMCSMVFESSEELMKHCLVRHQEIAQVVLV